MYGYYNDHHNDPQHNDLEHYTDLLSNQIPNLPAVAEAWDGEGEEETNTTAMCEWRKCFSFFVCNMSFQKCVLMYKVGHKVWIISQLSV